MNDRFVNFQATASGNLRVQLRLSGYRMLRSYVADGIRLLQRHGELPETFTVKQAIDRRQTRHPLLCDIVDVGDALHGVNLFDELLDYQLCNGWEVVRAEDIGALTANPYIISEDLEFDIVDDEYKPISDGTVYAYDGYEVFDPVVRLLQKGYIYLTAYPVEKTEADSLVMIS